MNPDSTGLLNILNKLPLIKKEFLLIKKILISSTHSTETAQEKKLLLSSTNGICPELNNTGDKPQVQKIKINPSTLSETLTLKPTWNNN
jgi:hypothetical protein